MKNFISADHTPFHLQILMNNPKLCKHEQQRGWVLFVFCWFVFSSSSETQTDRAVSCFSTPRTLERGYLIAQLLPAALHNVGHELNFWASTQDCHYMTPHWTFSPIWKHSILSAMHTWMRRNCWRVNPRKGKSEMVARSQSISQICNPQSSRQSDNSGLRADVRVSAVLPYNRPSAQAPNILNESHTPLT